jgi:hypothetical protein
MEKFSLTIYRLLYKIDERMIHIPLERVMGGGGRRRIRLGGGLYKLGYLVHVSMM